MSGFKLDDYVDVAERIREFNEKYPESSLQSELTFTANGWLCKAYAYRTPDDEKPGIGHAFEPVPGKTPYTKDSEAMNAETSAWGRAIVALGFSTKKIASRQEVEARQSGGGTNSTREAAPRAAQQDKSSGQASAASPTSYADKVPAKAQAVISDQGLRNVEAARRVKHGFGKKHLGLELGEIFDKDPGFISWLTTIEPNGNAEKLHEKQAALVILGRGDEIQVASGGEFSDADVPFDRTIT